jgi:hypothetical protein
MLFQKGEEFGEKMGDHAKAGAMRDVMHFIIIVYGKYAPIETIMICQ